jgi:GT2 family glycosyltransferase
MDISVVIVSWNAKKYLVDCVRSILETPAACTFEIIVVDNASSDGSPEAMEEHFPQVRLIRNAGNEGFAKANNIGIRAASGRYLCLVNSDVLVKENCMDNILRFMEENPRVGMSGPKVHNADGTLQISCSYFPTLRYYFLRALALDTFLGHLPLFSTTPQRDPNRSTPFPVGVLAGCFWMLRRSALDEVGLLDEGFFMYGEDYDWCQRFHKAGWEVMHYPLAEITHFGGASSANDPIRFTLEMRKASLRLWKKHRGGLSTACYLSLIGLHSAIRVLCGAAAFIALPGKRDAARQKMKEHTSILKWIVGM